MSYTNAGSLTYAEAGKRVRASRRRLSLSDAVVSNGRESYKLADSARAWKVWAACAELTASWSKGSDRLHVVTIANLAGVRQDKVSPILKAFDAEGIFTWRKDAGRRSKGLLSLPPLGDQVVEGRRSTPKPQVQCQNCQSTDLAPTSKGEFICQNCHEWLDKDGHLLQPSQ